MLAIGDVEYANRWVSRKSRAAPSWVPGVFSDLAELSGAHLQNLPESREVVLSISRIVGGDSKLLLGRDATETAFKAQPISQYRVVHLAVHAIADFHYPDRSALVLAADNPPEDSLLQVREITRLHLNADLVTLSACQTGVGPTEGEAGVINLEQAFLMAGAKAVVASLWNVEDQSTTVLMEAFYRHLAEGEDISMALTDAKRDFLKEHRGLSPSYWAAFVVVGEASSSIPFGQSLHK
jgi:CHAT domain-containing protein